MNKMKSLLNKRLPGILAVGLVALAVGAAGATSSASTNNASDKSGASISGLSSTQKKAKAKAMKKCKKIKNAKKRKACIKKVNKRFAPKPTGKTVVVNVDDDFYSPGLVNLKVNDSIRWDWKNADGREPHNVALTDGPTGVRDDDFTSPLQTGPSYTFTRKFEKAGSYDFVCQIHTLMTMKVDVTP